MKLILFDIDGTLLIGKGVGREAKALAMQDVYGTTANIRTHPFGGKTDWQILYEALSAHGVSKQTIGEKMPTYERVFAQRLAEVIPQFEVQALPHALDLVAELHERPDIMVGLVTGNASTTAPIKLQAAGFDMRHFVVGAYGSEAPDRNDLPQLALDRANALVTEPITPRDVIVVGDTPADVACARALGAVAVTVYTGFADRAELIAAQPDYALEDLTEFMPILGL